MTTPATLTACGFRGAARAMTPADVAAGAARLGTDAAMISALLDVESSGAGFDAVGRPKMLPERHIFYSRTAGTPAQAAAVKAGLAYPKQGTLPYPATSDACYAMLARMMALSPQAALESCSWGIAQVMGFNAKSVGYDDAAAMVLACLDSEAAQFDLMLAYLVKNGLLPAIKRRDFVAIATGYNGKGASAAYGAKLKAAYDHHATSAAAPAKLVAPALATKPLNPSQLHCPEWLGIRGGKSPDRSADDLNAAELARHGVGNADTSADALNAAELARIRGALR